MDRFSNRLVLISAFALLACTSPLAAAKNVVIQGERGTRWCCPDGKKGPDCKQFPASVPLGADCKLNIAIVPDPSITPAQAPVRFRNIGSRLTWGTTMGLPVWATRPVMPSPRL